MFTEMDYENYFSSIEAADKAMLKTLGHILSQIDDTDIRKVLVQMRDEEIQHLKLAKELFELLSVLQEAG